MLQHQYLILIDVIVMFSFQHQGILWRENEVYHVPVGDSLPSSNVICLLSSNKSSAPVSAYCAKTQVVSLFKIA